MSKAICLVDPAIRLAAQHVARLSPYRQVVSGFDISVAEKKRVETLLLHSKVTSTFVQQLPALNLIGVRAKNLSYVPDDVRKEIKVYGIPSLADTAVAEHVFALILGIQKNIVSSDRNVREGHWRQNLPMNTELSGKKLGIIGYGVIGQRVARIAEAFGVEVLVARSPRSKASEHLPLEDVLREADVVSLHVSSRPENVRLIDASKFEMMKKGAVLINTSRGDMVDEEALLKALNEGHLSAAGLDVLVQEPPKGISLELARHEKVLATPHVGFVTVETTEKMTDALVTETVRQLQ